MLCSAAPEKVSALNLKRLKADNKTCGQPQKETPSVRMVFSFWNAAGRLELAASTCAQCVKSSAMRAPRAGICS